MKIHRRWKFILSVRELVHIPINRCFDDFLCIDSTEPQTIIQKITYSLLQVRVIPKCSFCEFHIRQMSKFIVHKFVCHCGRIFVVYANLLAVNDRLDLCKLVYLLGLGYRELA